MLPVCLQVTVVPTGIVRELGENELSRTDTSFELLFPPGLVPITSLELLQLTAKTIKVIVKTTMYILFFILVSLEGPDETAKPIYYIYILLKFNYFGYFYEIKIMNRTGQQDVRDRKNAFISCPSTYLR